MVAVRSSSSRVWKLGDSCWSPGAPAPSRAPLRHPTCPSSSSLSPAGDRVQAPGEERQLRRTAPSLLAFTRRPAGALGLTSLRG